MKQRAAILNKGNMCHRHLLASKDYQDLANICNINPVKVNKTQCGLEILRSSQQEYRTRAISFHHLLASRDYQDLANLHACYCNVNPTKVNNIRSQQDTIREVLGSSNTAQEQYLITSICLRPRITNLQAWYAGVVSVTF